MMSLVIRVTLAVLVLHHVMLPCAALRSSIGRGYNTGKYEGQGYKDPGKPKTMAGTSPGLPSMKPTRRGLGISAWGIVFLVVTLALAGMGFYYFSMCYPILCKKERKYDMIQLDRVCTV